MCGCDGGRSHSCGGVSRPLNLLLVQRAGGAGGPFRAPETPDQVFAVGQHCGRTVSCHGVSGEGRERRTIQPPRHGALIGMRKGSNATDEPQREAARWLPPHKWHNLHDGVEVGLEQRQHHLCLRVTHPAVVLCAPARPDTNRLSTVNHWKLTNKASSL